MLSGRGAVIAGAKTNVLTVPHQHQSRLSSTGQLVSSVRIIPIRSPFQTHSL